MAALKNLYEPISEVDEHSVRYVSQAMPSLFRLVCTDGASEWFELFSRYAPVARTRSQPEARITVVHRGKERVVNYIPLSSQG